MISRGSRHLYYRNYFCYIRLARAWCFILESVWLVTVAVLVVSQLGIYSKHLNSLKNLNSVWMRDFRTFNITYIKHISIVLIYFTGLVTVVYIQMKYTSLISKLKSAWMIIMEDRKIKPELLGNTSIVHIHLVCKNKVGT